MKKLILSFIFIITPICSLASSLHKETPYQFVIYNESGKSNKICKIQFSVTCPKQKSPKASEYINARGYFNYNEPIEVEYGYNYKITLENGKDYYYFLYTKIRNTDSLLVTPGDELIPIDMYYGMINFEEQPLVKGSDILIINKAGRSTLRNDSYSYIYTLSNGKTIWEEKLRDIRILVENFGVKPEKAHLLTDNIIITKVENSGDIFFGVEHRLANSDNFNFVVSPNKDGKSNSVYVTIKSSNISPEHKFLSVVNGNSQETIKLKKIFFNRNERKVIIDLNDPLIDLLLSPKDTILIIHENEFYDSKSNMFIIAFKDQYKEPLKELLYIFKN